MYKKIILSSLLTISAYMIAYVVFNDLKTTKIENYLESYTDEKYKQYQSIYDSFRKLAITSFYVSVNKKEVIDLLSQVKKYPQMKKSIRDTLYRDLKSDYRVLKMHGMKYLHFHLPNGESFLRFDKRRIYGDKVSDIRGSVEKVRTTKLPYEGIEEAGYYPAFRFVYPLLDTNNMLVGTAEVSFDINEIKNVFERSFLTSANMIFSKEAMEKSSYLDLENVFTQSKEHKGFLVDKGSTNIRFNSVRQLNKDQITTFSKRIRKGVKENKSFSLAVVSNENSKVVTFIALKNTLSDNVISYIVLYSDDIYISSLQKEFLVGVVVSLVLFILFGYIFYSELRKKEILKNLVDNKTLEVRKLYNQEHYLKGLLETVTKVNESLITAYSEKSVIETTLENLALHDSYKLITYGYVEENKIDNRESFGDKDQLIGDELLDLSISRSYKNHFFKSAVFAVIEDKTLVNLNIKSHENIKSSISVIVKGEGNVTAGVLTIFSENNHFDKEEISLLEAVATDISMAINVSQQRTMVQRLQQKQISNYEETILAFVDMIEHRDQYTAGHTLRVAKYCKLIASEFNIDRQEIKRLEKAAILHDIGKIATPDSILLKPGRLSNLEYNLIKEHVVAGYEMLSKVELYKDLAEIIRYHHEHYDGGGYPEQKKGDEIPFLAHILMVADAFDAMTTNRIYKSRLTPQEAAQEILKCANKQFHPKVAKVAAKVLSALDIERTTQLPQTSLEEQRFAYFFSDNLTDLYNINYLELVLNSTEKYDSINIVNIKNMTEYNRKVGWEEGNQFLIKFADYLKTTYVNSLIFRYQGDDYVILSKKNILVNENLLQKEIAEYPILDITIENIQTQNGDYARFKKIFLKSL